MTLTGGRHRYLIVVLQYKKAMLGKQRIKLSAYLSTPRNNNEQEVRQAQNGEQCSDEGYLTRASHLVEERLLEHSGSPTWK